LPVAVAAELMPVVVVAPADLEQTLEHPVDQLLVNLH
jgi:hypothetical protein